MPFKINYLILYSICNPLKEHGSFICTDIEKTNEILINSWFKKLFFYFLLFSIKTKFSIKMNALNVVLILFSPASVKNPNTSLLKLPEAKGVLNVNLKTEHQNNVF